jgi:hypothetical protein
VSPCDSLPQPLPEQPAELAYVHLYSEVLSDETYLVNRALSHRERPTDHACYTIPEAEVLRFIGTDVMGVVHMLKEVFPEMTIVKARRPRIAVNEKGQDEGPTREVFPAKPPRPKRKKHWERKDRHEKPTWAGKGAA